MTTKPTGRSRSHGHASPAVPRWAFSLDNEPNLSKLSAR